MHEALSPDYCRLKKLYHKTFIFQVCCVQIILFLILWSFKMSAEKSVKFSHWNEDKVTEISGLADYFSLGWSKSRKRLNNERVYLIRPAFKFKFIYLKPHKKIWGSWQISNVTESEDIKAKKPIGSTTIKWSCNLSQCTNGVPEVYVFTVYYPRSRP